MKLPQKEAIQKLTPKNLFLFSIKKSS